jgi:urease accessory protein UreF
MDTTARGYPAGDLRVSDADRDAALAELSEHFQAGRLTSDELDERIGQAIRARTGQDLAGLMADLPAARRPGGTRPGTGAAVSTAASAGTGLASRRTLTTAVIIAVTAIVTAAVIAASLGHTHGHGFVVPGWVIVAGFFAWRRLVPRRQA